MKNVVLLKTLKNGEESEISAPENMVEYLLKDSRFRLKSGDGAKPEPDEDDEPEQGNEPIESPQTKGSKNRR